jgi:Predicted membrane protein
MSRDSLPVTATRFRRLVSRLVGDQRVRFLIVGGINTAVGYALFVAIELLVGQRFEYGYFVSLYGSFFLATLVAFWLHRHYTYRVTGTGNVVIDFLRFQSVYLVSLGINTVALWFLVDIAHVIPTIAQAFIVVVTTCVSYLGHKFFSFRRPAAPAPADESES